MASLTFGRRSVTLKLGRSHLYVHFLKPRLDSDGIPMRYIEFDAHLGNLMILTNFTFSKVRK